MPVRLIGDVSSRLQSIPRPTRNAEAIGNVVRRVVVPGHGCVRRPGEIVVQNLPERILGKPYIGECLIETDDRAQIHLLVGSVAAVHPHDTGFVPVKRRVGCGPTERLRPVGGKPLRVIGMEAVAERVADHFVRDHPFVPGTSQAPEAVDASHSLVNRFHSRIMARAGVRFRVEPRRTRMASATAFQALAYAGYVQPNQRAGYSAVAGRVTAGVDRIIDCLHSVGRAL